MHSPRRPLAFVLSGGASLGAIEAGMVRALYERGIEPDLVVGTSAGALNGAFLAAHPPTVETADELIEIWRGLRRGEVFPTSFLTGLRGFAGGGDHLVPARGLRKLIETHLPLELLDDGLVPLHVVAVDVLTGEELLLSDGPAADAVLASASIPAVLPPVEWDGRLLVDGGIANNTPISHAIALGAREVWVLSTGHACALDHAPRGALAMALHALSLLTHRRLVDDIETYRGGDARLVVLPPPCPLTVSPIDFSHAGELIARSLDDARRFLDEGGASRPPISMRTHRHGAAAVRNGRPLQLTGT